MTEKDLDVAIEMCERIMEFDTRTMQNPVSENGWIFEKVYELLQYLRQFQFATDTNVGDAISRKAAIETVKKHYRGIDNDLLEVIAYEMEELPSAQLAQDLTNGCTDTISRAAVVDAIEGVDWYHQNKNGEMVHGANSDEHQAWYKAEDIYKAIESVPSAQSNLSEAYSKAVFTWLMDYQIRAAELKGRYTPYEVLSWVVNDWRKEHERSD